MRTDRHIVLVGLMGAGKSTLGRQLALACQLPFIDADTSLSSHLNLSIPDAFRIHGEPAFRTYEEQHLLKLLDAPSPCVLALGGGGFEHADVRRRCSRDDVFSIWLDVSPEEAERRVREDDNERPLLERGDDPLAILRDLLAARRDNYRAADMRLIVDGRSISELAQEVLDALD